MSKVKKLTPSILKKIIMEEKTKITAPVNRQKTDTSVKSGNDVVSESRKLALQELKCLIEIKRIRTRRNVIKQKLTNKNKK